MTLPTWMTMMRRKRLRWGVWRVCVEVGGYCKGGFNGTNLVGESVR